MRVKVRLYNDYNLKMKFNVDVPDANPLTVLETAKRKIEGAFEKK